MSTKMQTERAIARWLLSSSHAPEIPSKDWDDGKPAIIRTGGAFDAVRMPQELVHAAVGLTDPAEVSVALAEVLDGPVICHPGSWYYALVPTGTCETWRSALAVVRGSGGWVGIPRVDRTEPTAVAAYWAVPVERTDKLCDPAAVAELLGVGRERIEGRES
ncbi:MULTISPECIES: hypothetical protein [unclassified Streptomyces]|uniref:hypothetical protein n=1 Tax=unclassified Streptomyces TaxID=2593676 RepID=UPI00081D507F|nr:MULTISPECIES: hypothetical protein [unclassified Streptomyces]MYZ35481.1 hypothetical protein [Streptomyces sp. SID4917]SCF75808.1 hypothetical protein GA0115259_1021213 [Streptomyces sp. MnatMP-M17]